jgi:Domain of unknown function (DUF1996)
MKHLTFKARTSFSLVALAAIATLGCSGQIEDNTGDYQFAVLTQQWTPCAAQGEHCEFSGTREVRFGADGRTETRSFTDGVMCSNRAFGVRFGRGNTCEVLLDTEVDEQTTEHGSHDADAGAAMDHGGMSGATAPSGAMMGPTIDRSAIPSGDPGVSEREISSTSEQPNPDPEIGAFRTSCLFSHMNFDDPIVYPGQPGKAHLHTYFGNTGANASSTAESLRSSGNSTCRGGIANRTAYWVPAVIDGSGRPVAPESGQFYYKTGYSGIAPSEIQPFPQGLRMIAGDAKSAAPGQTSAYWSCHENSVGHPSAIPTCPVGDRVVMVVQFPQCWDGTNLDSADHKSHMSYPVQGDCPSTHPVAIPEITFNIYYKVDASTDSSRWRLASDMYDPSLPGGYSAHADYFEGWEREVAEAFVRNCDSASMDCHSHLLGDGRMIYNSRETY